MVSTNALLPFIPRMAGTHIVCVGDVMLDQFVYGSVNRVSPEAPVPVLSVTRRVYSAGGVGNVAANLVGLGASVRLVSVAGQDTARQTLGEILNDMKGLDATLVTDPSRPTIRKTRFIGGAQQMLRVDDETTNRISADVEKTLIDTCLEAMESAQAVILSDYGKGILTAGLIKAVIDAANARNIPVLVDPKGRDYTRYRGASVITPNARELAEATGLPVVSDADVTAAARMLIDAFDIKSIVATRSADGMTVLDGAEPTHLRALAREVFDVSGAGDTVIATLAAALAAGADLKSAAALANTAGGIVVEKVGTAAIRADDLRARLDADQTSRTFAPVLDWQQAREQVERWRARGLSVGFTNGCFDLLHRGHVTMLDKCRAACDRLVLGLNSDASVSRLKGPDRPVTSQDARAEVVAALGSVDTVVLFGEDIAENDTPLDLIKALRPDMIFKGADYTAETVAGADFVQSYGGRVVLIPLESGYSTTNTIQKLGSAA